MDLFTFSDNVTIRWYVIGHLLSNLKFHIFQVLKISIIYKNLIRWRDRSKDLRKWLHPDDDQFDIKIVGGKVSKANSYPFVDELLSRADMWSVVTATHCFQGDPR